MSQVHEILSRWERHRAALLDLLEKIDDQHVNFKPWDGAMSLSELALHVAGAGIMFSEAVKTGALVKPNPSPAAISMNEVRDRVHSLTVHTKETISSLSDEQLESLVDATQAFGFSLPGKALLNAMTDHEIHHKGQLFVYARSVGVEEMPFFIKR